MQYVVDNNNDQRVIEIPETPSLPGPIADGLRVALGHSASVEDIESLHSRHPLIEAAVRESRQTGTGDFRVRFVLGDEASPVLEAQRSSRGRLALTKVVYSGYESEDRLVVTAIFEDSEVLRPAEAAHELLRLPCEDLDDTELGCTLTQADLDEVVDEELFLDQSDVSRREQKSFERAVDQLNQFMDDRALVLRRELVAAAGALERAEIARDNAHGADARQAAQKRVLRCEQQLQVLEVELEKISSRSDVIYEKWSRHAHSRRYRPPEPERLFNVEFVIA